MRVRRTFNWLGPALHDVPEVSTEATPVEPPAPRRMHRRRDKGVHEASTVPSFALLGLREPDGLVVREGYRETALAAFSFSTTQSVESEMTRSKSSRNQKFVNNCHGDVRSQQPVLRHVCELCCRVLACPGR